MFIVSYLGFSSYHGANNSLCLISGSTHFLISNRFNTLGRLGENQVKNLTELKDLKNC